MALDDPAPTLALDARYGGAAPEARLLWNETIATILAHRSVRAYSDRPLPDGILETLTAAAQSASTSSNLQFWSVVTVTDRPVKAKLAVLAGNQRHIDDAPLLLLFVADLARSAALAGRNAAPADALDYLDSFLVGALDSALAAQNAAIAAESLGLGTVYIGGLRNRPIDVAEAVGLPARTTILFGLVVGWPDPARPAAVKPRLPQSVVLHRERYSADGHAEEILADDDRSRAFQAAAGLPASGWIAPSLTRAAGPQSLHGREGLRSTFAEQGLPLL